MINIFDNVEEKLKTNTCHSFDKTVFNPPTYPDVHIPGDVIQEFVNVTAEQLELMDVEERKRCRWDEERGYFVIAKERIY